MKKLSYIIYFFAIFLNSCGDGITPVNIVSTKIDIAGTSENVDVIVGHYNGVNSTITPYSNVTLPFDMFPFEIRSGDTIAVLAFKLDSNNLMQGQIVVNGNVVANATSNTDIGIKYVVPFP